MSCFAFGMKGAQDSFRVHESMLSMQVSAIVADFFFVLTNMVIFFKWPNKFYLLKNIFIAYHNFKQPNNNNSNTTLNIRCTLFLCYYDAYMYIYAQKQQHILHYKCYPYLIYLWFFLQYF